ncbi:RagB/SusD family nutrient uptake outer membrane protein [Sinomicrobium pectinilyticum]|nr:RagB/SusD family nutrient uptake outer membrane protein [Sinomicrobium pectinilyticum]
MKTKSIYTIPSDWRIFFLKYISQILIGLSCALLLFSCEELLDVEPPRNQVVSEKVFASDETAEATAKGLYADMLSQAAFGGTHVSLLALTGLSSDELFYAPGDEPTMMQFEENTLMADNPLVLNLWSSMYQSIYSANLLIERLQTASQVTSETKKQLRGEALFIRAFSHFYLVNLFGDIPVFTTPDYRENSTASRTEISVVYFQIEEDLLEAQDLLDNTYPHGDRVRPNKATATALLARVYLYMEEWEKAENQASIVIDDTNYGLVDFNSITLSNNKEAIWQLHSSSLVANSATNEGYYFNLPSGYNALREEFLNEFEPNDIRKDEWIRLDVSSFLAPYKYKVSAPGANRSEYSTVFRLAEQYLIRAEARAHQNKLGDAIADVDVIRQRAGLALIADSNPGIGQQDLLDVILQERRLELFTEWGHRWLDLKRTGRATTVLSVLKSGFTKEDELYPIPQEELNNSPNLNDQNPGY